MVMSKAMTYFSKTDVVVCDGFAGNVSLKTAEGVAFMIKDFLKKEFSSQLEVKLHLCLFILSY